MSNDITELRSILFDAMRGLKDGKIDVDKAKAISDIGQVIINSAKVEVDHIKAHGGGKSSQFIEGTPQLPAGITAIRQHRIR